MYKCVNKLAPNYLCNMFTPRALSFDLRDASQKLYLPKPRISSITSVGEGRPDTRERRKSSLNQELTTWSVASAIAELLFGTIFLKLPEDTRTAKSLRNFNRRIDKWLSISDSVPHDKYVYQLIDFFFVFYCHTDIFTVFLNKDFIHSVSHSFIHSFIPSFLFTVISICR